MAEGWGLGQLQSLVWFCITSCHAERSATSSGLPGSRLPGALGSDQVQEPEAARHLLYLLVVHLHGMFGALLA